MSRPSATSTLTGKVARVVVDRGFCFITCDQDSQDYFCHFSALDDLDLKTLQIGQRVEFTTEPSPKGPRAANVRAISGNR